jgi:hypothetical protein
METMSKNNPLLNVCCQEWLADKWTMNWKGFRSVHGLTQVLSWHLLNRLMNATKKNFSQDNQCLSQDSNQAPSKWVKSVTITLIYSTVWCR